MGFKMPSNRRLKPQNTKVVNTAINRIKTTAAIAQEKYWNAFQVNGYDCFVYNRLMQGRRCSCTLLEKKGNSESILDEDGNASPEFIQNLLGNGAGLGIEKYATERNKKTNGNNIRTYDVDDDTEITNSLDGSTGESLEDFQSDFIEEDYTEGMLENDIDVHTAKCAVCFGSGFVGGYALSNGQRIVLDTTYDNKKLYGYSIDQTSTPYVFKSVGSPNDYVSFEVTLPKNVSYVNAFQTWHNIDKIDAELEFSLDGISFHSESELLDFFTGQPVYIRVKGPETFTHLEIQMSLVTEPHLLDYPKITRISDLNLLDAYTDVSLMVSPRVSTIKAWDVIADNTHGLYWLVKEATDHKDRNMNMHGWEVNARLIQKYEINKYLPIDKTSQSQLPSTFNRY